MNVVENFKVEMGLLRGCQDESINADSVALVLD
jgi:hypothetical protein